MFAKTIIDSDAFLDMPLSTQALYFHLSMRADDDGFINNPKKIQRSLGCSDDDLKLLIVKKFIVPFESGIVVIKHWRIHNYIQKDRYKETVYQEEKNMLEIKNNKAYTLKNEQELIAGNKTDTECIHNAYGLETQVRLGKISINTSSLQKTENESQLDDEDVIPLETKSKKTKVKKVFSTEDKEYKLASYLSKQIAKRLNKPLQKEETLQRWAADFEKTVRIDGNDIDEVKDVLVFSQKDPFWQANIMSAGKFRKQYMTLLAKMKQGEEP